MPSVIIRQVKSEEILPVMHEAGFKVAVSLVYAHGDRIVVSVKEQYVLEGKQMVTQAPDMRTFREIVIANFGDRHGFLLTTGSHSYDAQGNIEGRSNGIKERSEAQQRASQENIRVAQAKREENARLKREAAEREAQEKQAQAVQSQEKAKQKALAIIAEREAARKREEVKPAKVTKPKVKARQPVAAHPLVIELKGAPHGFYPNVRCEACGGKIPSTGKTGRPRRNHYDCKAGV